MTAEEMKKAIEASFEIMEEAKALHEKGAKYGVKNERGLSADNIFWRRVERPVKKCGGIP
jgi:hypothetical protein